MKSLLENEYKPKLIDASYVCTEKESIHEIKAWFLCMQIIVQLNVENNSTNAAILFSELQLLEPSIKSLPAIQCIPLSALEIGLYLSRNGKQEEGQTYFKKAKSYTNYEFEKYLYYQIETHLLSEKTKEILK